MRLARSYRQLLDYGKKSATSRMEPLSQRHHPENLGEEKESWLLVAQRPACHSARESNRVAFRFFRFGWAMG